MIEGESEQGPSMGESKQQLKNSLRQSIRDASSSRRPVLSHLNADTSWLLQLPYPPDAERPPGRSRWNILIDPWFNAPSGFANPY